MGDDFEAEIFFSQIFRKSLSVEKFLTHVLSLVLRRIFLGQKMLSFCGASETIFQCQNVLNIKSDHF